MPPTELDIARVVEGTVTVPCFLENDGCAVGAGFNRGADGLPAQKPGNEYTAFFRCVIPRDLPAGGGGALIYGHGLLGNPLDSERLRPGQLRTLAHERGFTVCGTYWSGLSAHRRGHRPGGAPRSRDLSKFGASSTGSSRGCSTTSSSAARWSPRTACSTRLPVVRGRFDATGRLFYDGNSQGGIEGGALTAVAPDFDRAVLGVPGMNYSTLLQRSVDFDAVPRPARRRLREAAGPRADLLAAGEPVGPRRGERLRAAHDGRPAAEHAARTRCCCTSHSATTRWRPSPPTSRRARSARACGPSSIRAAAPTWSRSTGSRADGVPVRGLGARRVRRGPAHAGEPAGHAGARRRRTCRRRRARTRTSSRAARRGARDEGPVPAHRRPPRRRRRAAAASATPTATRRGLSVPLRPHH